MGEGESEGSKKREFSMQCRVPDGRLRGAVIDGWDGMGWDGMRWEYVCSSYLPTYLPSYMGKKKSPSLSIASYPPKLREKGRGRRGWVAGRAGRGVIVSDKGNDS